jgi:hypothetical protein
MNSFNYLQRIVDMITTVVISDTMFQGFRRVICTEQFDSFKKLCEYMKEQLISELTILELTNLIEKAKTLELHNHTMKTMSDIIETRAECVWLCSECCENDEEC